MTTLLALLVGASSMLAPSNTSNTSFSPSVALSKIVLDEVVFEDGDVISGTIQAQHVTIPTDATVYVDGDLTLLAIRSLTIAGDLVANDAGTIVGAIDGPSITLQSNGRLTIFGDVIGGSGRSYGPSDPDGTAGGAGSEILLDSPDFLVSGQVFGGHGGDAAPGGKGGTGGSITALGTSRTTHGLRLADLAGMGSHIGIIAGNGGLAGNGTPTTEPGEGGDGGGVNSALLASATIQDPVTDPNTFCPRHGTAGPDIFVVESGIASAGGVGTSGTPGTPTGGRGEKGGEGKFAEGVDAPMKANSGKDCCNPTQGLGGNGSAGAKGGAAIGGKGGAGGPGGSAYTQSTPPGVQGLGGTGGDGGGAQGGTGGGGGDGGNGMTPGAGGVAAAGGAATTKGPGLGGTGSTGNGPTGGQGTLGLGNGGAAGIGGGLCPN